MPSQHLEDASQRTRTESEARLQILMAAIEHAQMRLKHLYSIERMGAVASEEMTKIFEAADSYRKVQP